MFLYNHGTLTHTVVMDSDGETGELAGSVCIVVYGVAAVIAVARLTWPGVTSTDIDGLAIVVEMG